MDNRFKVGDKVHYTAPHGAKENGIVKEVRSDRVFVVYKCGGEWDNYQNYTGQSTNPDDLSFGWTK
jgi:ABC-type lipoprotein release transport system permease subunit